jgi:hypothetical protein
LKFEFASYIPLKLNPGQMKKEKRKLQKRMKAMAPRCRWCEQEQKQGEFRIVRKTPNCQRSFSQSLANAYRSKVCH